MIDPKELAQTSLSRLEEAVLAFLFSKHPSRFEPNQIARSLGIGGYGYSGNDYALVRGVLHKLKAERQVYPDGGDRPGWGLTEREIKARSRE